MSSEVRCVKHGCTETQRLQRHHKRHQAMWLGIWAGRRAGEPRFKEFVRRYYEFRLEDVALLHDDHHAEIHSIYDQIIAKDVARIGVSLYHYTWAQATALMNKLEKAFDEWVVQQTPGVDSAEYAMKRKRAAAARRRARR